jgi:hypothetical protein
MSTFSSWNCAKYCDQGGFIVEGEHVVFQSNQPLPPVVQGGFKTRVVYLSIDPTQRIWMTSKSIRLKIILFKFEF